MHGKAAEYNQTAYAPLITREQIIVTKEQVAIVMLYMINTAQRILKLYIYQLFFKYWKCIISFYSKLPRSFSHYKWNGRKWSL